MNDHNDHNGHNGHNSNIVRTYCNLIRKYHELKSELLDSTDNSIERINILCSLIYIRQQILYTKKEINQKYYQNKNNVCYKILNYFFK